MGEGFSTWLPLESHFLMRRFGGWLFEPAISQVVVCVIKYWVTHIESKASFSQFLLIALLSFTLPYLLQCPQWFHVMLFHVLSSSLLSLPRKTHSYRIVEVLHQNDWYHQLWVLFKCWTYIFLASSSPLHIHPPLIIPYSQCGQCCLFVSLSSLWQPVSLQNKERAIQ